MPRYGSPRCSASGQIRQLKTISPPHGQIGIYYLLPSQAQLRYSGSVLLRKPMPCDPRWADECNRCGMSG